MTKDEYICISAALNAYIECTKSNEFLRTIVFFDKMIYEIGYKLGYADKQSVKAIKSKADEFLTIMRS